MDTITMIRDIFYSGTHSFTGDLESANEIAFLLDNGYIQLNTVRIADKRRYLHIAHGIGTSDAYDAAGGGNTHVALKILSAEYVQRDREQEARFEQPFCGYYPDVISKDRLVVVECGHTQNPAKILDYFRYGHVRECIQVPYPLAESNLVTGYSFTANSRLNEFLRALAASKNSKIKELFFKRKSMA